MTQNSHLYIPVAFKDKIDSSRSGRSQEVVRWLAYMCMSGKMTVWCLSLYVVNISGSIELRSKCDLFL